MSASGEYTVKLPKGVTRMVDQLVFRLLTGRIVLSEATIAHALARLRHNWAYCEQRELWKGRKPKGDMMADKALVRQSFRDYGRCLGIIAAFIAESREKVASSIR